MSTGEVTLFLASKEETSIYLQDVLDDFKKNIEYAYNDKLLRKQYELIYRETINGRITNTIILKDNIYQTVKRKCLGATNPGVFYLKITLLIYKESDNNKDIVRLPQNVEYETICGFDAKFTKNLDDAIKRCLKSKGLTTKSVNDVRCILTNESYTETSSLTEDNLYHMNLFVLLLQVTCAYSSVVVADIKDLVALPPTYTDIHTFIVSIASGQPSSTALKELVDDLSIQVPSFDKKVAYSVQGLSYIADCIQASDAYNEATRRMIIDCILLPALAQDEKKNDVELKPEYYMPLSDQVHRVGRGPLDYYIASSVPVITASVKNPASQKDAEDGDETEDLEELAGDSLLAAEPVQRTLLEAKTLVEPDNLHKSLGQLVAQMLDGLNLELTRKRDVDGMVKKGEEVRSIKGILSTGHHTLFFSLRKAAGSERPLLQYYGRYVVDVLPKISGRDSGLQVGEPVKQVQVERVLRALYLFTKNMGVI